MEGIPVQRNKLWHRKIFYNLKGSFQVVFENYSLFTLQLICENCISFSGLSLEIFKIISNEVYVNCDINIYCFNKPVFIFLNEFKIRFEITRLLSMQPNIRNLNYTRTIFAWNASLFCMVFLVSIYICTLQTEKIKIILFSKEAVRYLIF